MPVKTGTGRGGSRKGGRPAGAMTKRNREIAERVAKLGITPLEVMVSTMRALHRRATYDGRKKRAEKDVDLVLLRQASEEAARAAPYMHPRLTAIEVGGKNGQPIAVTFTPLDAGSL